MSRIKLVKKALKNYDIDAFFIKNIFNVRYLCGFSGSAGSVLITKKNNYFISDFRYKTQAASEVNKDFEILIYKQQSDSFLKEYIKSDKIKTIGVESNFMTISDFDNLKSLFKKVKFVKIDSLIENIVAVKTPDEISNIKSAVDITDKVFGNILGILKPGISEKRVSAEISYLQKLYGAEKDAFDPIVASGERSSLPHARPTDRVLKEGDFVTLDFGCCVNGFNSDMTRTVGIGHLTDEQISVYNIVKDAQKLALDGIKAGVKGKKVDAMARDFIKEKGFGQNFGHGLGHGLGLAVHEIPKLNPFSEYKLKTGNVVTVEPGIYLENSFGVRIEDDVVVTESGCDILNNSDKELIIL
ncbi:MAG TPA: Xaa-Pro peptidase family protein [Ignavibacteria bacterium]|nr:Xaa-Pro peptidase family protein [Ignavibacteria bacterium]